MNILGVIAARGGSKGVVGKNVRFLAGKSLIAYSIEQMNRWGKYKKFIVSTDSQEIAEVSRKWGAEVPFMRPPELAGDDTGKLKVLRHAFLEAEKYYGMRFDILVDLDATSPVRTVKDIENMLDVFKKKKADCVFSVVKARKNPYFNMIEENDDGTARVCKKASLNIGTRQTAPTVYEMNASIYIYSREYLLDEKINNPYSGRSFAYQMQEESSTDIDTERDFDFIEYLVKTGKVKL